MPHPRAVACSAGIAIALVAMTRLCAAAPSPARPCDSALTYFRSTASGAHRIEWRVFDPVRKADRLFLSLPAPPTLVRWDESFTFVEYESGDSVYRADWRVGARPAALIQIPAIPERCDLWFNPDSSTWQAASSPGGAEDRSTDDFGNRCAYQLWQRSRETGGWRMIRADSAGCDGTGCSAWYWDEIPGSRHADRIGMDGLLQLFWRGEGLRGLDWASPPPGERALDPNVDDGLWWISLSSEQFPERSIMCPGTSNEEGIQTCTPAYYVDRRRGTSLLLKGARGSIETPGSGLTMEEGCGYVLIDDPWSTGEGARLLSLATGRWVRVFKETTPVWVGRFRE